MNNPLFDFNFLVDLMNYQHKEIHARITLLTQNELPLQQIEGRVTGGSINVDGNSALRRTCNLSLILKDHNEINNFHWAFKQKFKLEIGLSNFINDKYPNVIWFKQGIFIITSHDMTQSTNNYSITINGKDKMCLLNGDIAGSLPSSIDFGTIEYHDLVTDTITKTQVPLKTIIYEAVHNYGNELAENIIINDLDDLGLELLEYRNENGPLFGLRDADGQVSQMILDETHTLILADSPGSEIEIGKIPVYATTSDLIDDSSSEATKVKEKDNDDSRIYTVLKFEYGDLAGYRLTDLVYAGELIGNIGESLTSVLDKIKNMLGEFEYFYNVDGKFVFQKKRKYISTPWNSNEQDSKDSQMYLSDTLPIVKLLDSKLVTSFANRPNLANIKNDFSVWGTYKSISGVDIPIHMRYAIDTKPTSYRVIRPVKQQIDKGTFIDEFEDKNYPGDKSDLMVVQDGNITSFYAKEPLTTADWDWRELIYQMALDYRKCQNDDNFLFNLASANPQYSTGRTGYEQYYTDLEGFWRVLYNPNPDSVFLEIDAEKVTSDNQELIYVNNPHRPLTKEEILKISEYFKDEANNTLEIDPSQLFVIEQITIKDGENEKLIDTFYPFIGSSLCCLEYEAGEDGNEKKSKVYSYISGDYYKSSDSKELLDSKDLKKLYELNDNNEATPIISIRYKNIITEIEKEIEKGQTVLWIKDDGKIRFNDLTSKCQEIYQRGSSNLVNYLYNWSIVDNYGTKSTTQEDAYKIDYLLEEPNGEYENDLKNHDYWNKSVYSDPDKIVFWFDFLDAENSDIFQYSVKEIGSRIKSINDSNVKSIYYRDVPTTVFVPQLSAEHTTPGYTKIFLSPRFESLFNISAKGKSAKERVDELLFTHSYSIESTTINTIPIYYLEPNTRILVRDKESNVDGEYLVSKITIPLTYNGTMNLTATKVVSN